MTAIQTLGQHRRHLLTVEDFLLLAESGAFVHNTRTELIEGEIFAMNALGIRHSHVHSRIHIGLGNALAAFDNGLDALIAPSVRMEPDSVPEPDIVVASIDLNDRWVSLQSVRLAIEVSDSTLAFDVSRKTRLYARHNVPEYWIVDVRGNRIIQLWSPSGEDYAERIEIPFGAQLEARTIPGLAIETDGIA